MNAQPIISASLASVPDPTDWDDTRLPLLNPLDSALRCDICKDFYNSPVITNCSHTFCSGCIRRALNAEQICPICRAPEQEYRLRKNPAVQGLVDAFLGARPKLLEVAREVVQLDSLLSSQLKEEEPRSPPAKRSRPSSRVTRSTRSTPKYTEDHGDDIVEVPAPSDGLVPCPSCQKRMKIEMMNSHLDSCLADEYKPPASSQSALSLRAKSARSSKSAPSNSAPTTPPRPLPKISFSLLKEKDLRNKLADLGIPSAGPKKLLQERYSEWMTIWNANIDAERSRNKKELLAELASWERAHVQPSNQPTKERWSVDQWRNTHVDQFETLVKQAKARAEAAKKKKVEDSAKEGAQEGVQEGVDEGIFQVERVHGMHACSRGSSGQSRDGTVEKIDLATLQTRVVVPMPGPPMDEPNEVRGSMIMAQPNLGSGPQMGDQDIGENPNYMNVDSQDFSSHNGKRKYNEIDGVSLTGTD